MEEFRTVYLRLCKEYNIDPQPAVLAKTGKDFLDGGTLDLSNQSLEFATCTVLGKLFGYDLPVIHVLLADCMLSEECAKLLLEGLSKNTVVKTLDLRGNNLRTIGAESLGKYLKNNHTLETLILEWNALGIWEVSFAAFCDGLVANSSLLHLDLRNNQIDHKAAQQLALSLRSNATLQTLNLNWNNIGLTGGRALSESLQLNHTLNKVEVTGNNIPRDVLASLEGSTLHNQDRAEMSATVLNRTKTLTKEIEFLKEEKKKQLITFMDDMDLTRSQLDATNEASTRKICRLQEALEERKSALNALRAKLDMAEASLSLCEQKATDQASLLELCRRDNQELVKTYEGQISKERADHNAQKERLETELEQTQSSLHESKQHCADLERKCNMQQDQMFVLKENIVQIKAEHRVALANADDRLATERKRMQAESQDLEDTRNRETEKLRLDMEERRREIEARSERIRLSKDVLENEIAELKAVIARERHEHDDALRRLRQQLKDEEKVQVEQLLQKCQKLTAEKLEMQKKLSVTSSELAESEAGRAASNIQAEGLKRSLDAAQKVLANKDEDTEDKISRVRADMGKKINQLEDEASKMSSLREKVVCLETRMAEQTAAHRDVVNERDKTIDQLTSKLRMVELSTERMREEEAKRAAALQAAICTYIQGSTIKTQS